LVHSLSIASGLHILILYGLAISTNYFTDSMKTGNHELALRRFDARISLPQLSALVSVLCGVYQGVDQRTSLLILEQDIRTTEREMLRREMEKRPGRIKVASFILTILMILMFMIPLILLIIKNLQSVGF